MRLVKISREIEKTSALLWNLFEVKITYFFVNFLKLRIFSWETFPRLLPYFAI